VHSRVSLISINKHGMAGGKVAITLGGRCRGCLEDDRASGWIKESSMSVAKVIEISSESPDSFEDAVEAGIHQAQKTLKNVREAWVAGQKVKIRDGKITAYRVDLKVTFLLE
jgi:flavin-binding protein dodecin